ncbi:MAG: hypothetical protein ACR2MO_08540 [Acidimicrobiales bacterium]
MTSTRVAPSCSALLEEASALWPDRLTASDGTIGDAAHRDRVSDHNPDAAGWVHAADLTHDPANGCDAHRWARDVAGHRDPRIRYLVSAGEIWTPAAGWSPYAGENRHDRHAHMSVRHADATRNDTSPWFAAGWKDDDVKPLDHTAALACPQYGAAARWEQTAEGGIWALAGAPDLGAYNRHPKLFPPVGGVPRVFLAMVPTAAGGYAQISTEGESYAWNPGG